MKGNKFIYKPLAIVQDGRLTSLEQDYLCLIAQLEKASGCTASNQYFADYFRVSRPRAVEVITSLRKKCFVSSSEIKQYGKTLERTIRIIDEDSKKALLPDSKESLPVVSKETPAELVRKRLQVSKESPVKVSKESPYPTIESTIDNINSSPQNPPEFKLAELLQSLILSRKPDFKKQNLQQWAKYIDLMMRIDGRTPERIEAVIRWTQQDIFWQNNILSTAKLRKQFDQLELKMPKNKTAKANSPKLCFIDGKSAIEIKSNVYLCDDCQKLFKAAQTPLNHNGITMPKDKLSSQQIKDLVLKQRALHDK